LALLAALENRPQTTACLLGYADKVHVTHGKSREVNEARCAECAEHMARQQLDEAQFERLKSLGAGLRHEDVESLAFALIDQAL
jgi:hypothetical protein